MTQAAVKRFDFDALQDFAAPAPPPIEIVKDNTLPEAEALAPPPPPSFSEEELAAAKAAAWEEGREAGQQEEIARQNTQDRQRQQQIETACTALAQQAVTLAERQQAFMRTQTQELAALVLMLTRKVAGDAIRHLPEGGIEHLLRQCLPVLQEQPRVIVCVHPDLCGTIEEKLHALLDQHHLETAVTVKGKPELSPGEARLEWADGSATRDMTAIWKQVEDIIATVDFTLLADAAQTQQAATQQTTDNTNHDKGEQT